MIRQSDLVFKPGLEITKIKFVTKFYEEVMKNVPYIMFPSKSLSTKTPDND